MHWLGLPLHFQIAGAVPNLFRCRHVKAQTNWLAAVPRIVVGAGHSLTHAQTGQAQDWYPIECCHGMDCAPVEKIETLVPLSAAECR
jgi:hypothetical protein